MIEFLIIVLLALGVAYYFYRRYFFHKERIHPTKPHFTLKIEHE